MLNILQVAEELHCARMKLILEVLREVEHDGPIDNFQSVSVTRFRDVYSIDGAHATRACCQAGIGIIAHDASIMKQDLRAGDRLISMPLV